MTTSLISGSPRRDTCVQPRCRLAVDGDVLAVGGRPDAERVALRVDLRDRDLQGDRVDVVAGQEVLAAAHVARRARLADRDEVEDRADVREERVVTLAGEDADAVLRDDRLLGSGLVVVDADEPVEARADVVDRGLAGRERLAVLRRDPRLLGVAEEVRAGRRLEAEAVRLIRLPVAVAVDVDVVLGALGERVVVRPSGGILTGDPVGDDGERVRLVRAAERVQVRVVRGRILGDQRGLAVAGRVARAGADAGDEQSGENSSDDRQQNECP